MPKELQGALHSLYGNYEKYYRLWEGNAEARAKLDEFRSRTELMAVAETGWDQPRPTVGVGFVGGTAAESVLARNFTSILERDLFIAEVFFVSTREFTGLKFGGPIGDVRDPETGLRLERTAAPALAGLASDGRL